MSRCLARSLSAVVWVFYTLTYFYQRNISVGYVCSRTFSPPKYSAFYSYFGALTLLVGWQGGYPAVNISLQKSPTVLLWGTFRSSENMPVEYASMPSQDIFIHCFLLSSDKQTFMDYVMHRRSTCRRRIRNVTVTITVTVEQKKT